MPREYNFRVGGYRVEDIASAWKASGVYDKAVECRERYRALGVERQEAWERACAEYPVTEGEILRVRKKQRDAFIALAKANRRRREQMLVTGREAGPEAMPEVMAWVFTNLERMDKDITEPPIAGAYGALVFWRNNKELFYKTWIPLALKCKATERDVEQVDLSREAVDRALESIRGN